MTLRSSPDPAAPAQPGPAAPTGPSAPTRCALPLTALTAAAALAAAALLLGGCATPAPDQPVPPVRQAAQLGLTQASAGPAALVPERWWRQLGDPALDRLVDQALQDHPSLAVARARVQRAQALAGAVQAGHGPQVGLGADVTRQHYSAHGLVPAPIAGDTWTSANLQATLNWSPDFFGQQAAESLSALDQARAAQADAALATTGLAARLVRQHLVLARLLGQRELAERSLVQRQEIAALTRQRVLAGLDSRLEQTLAEGSIADARSQGEALDEQITLARRQLAVLAGLAPEALPDWSPRLAALQLLTLPPTLGADLLGRRPDVVAARWRIEAATQDLASAKAQFYPNVNLVAFVGLNALGLPKLVDWESRQMGVTPALRLPLFDGGRLRAQQGVRQADLLAAVAQYDGQVLQAVHESGDALASARALQAQQQTQATALASAEAAQAIARERYGAGVSGYLAVLNAETTWLAQRRQALDLQARRLDAQASLMQALGGGWVDDTAASLARR